MSGATKIVKIVTILNEKGLHTRPATELVKCASKFRSDISLYYRDLRVNAKSILGILMLAAGRGAKIKIEAEGEDAEVAIEAISALTGSKFNIGY